MQQAFPYIFNKMFLIYQESYFFLDGHLAIIATIC